MNYATSNYKASVKIHLSHFYLKKKNVEAQRCLWLLMVSHSGALLISPAHCGLTIYLYQKPRFEEAPDFNPRKGKMVGKKHLSVNNYPESCNRTGLCLESSHTIRSLFKFTPTYDKRIFKLCG